MNFLFLYFSHVTLDADIIQIFASHTLFQRRAINEFAGKYDVFYQLRLKSKYMPSPKRKKFAGVYG